MAAKKKKTKTAPRKKASVKKKSASAKRKASPRKKASAKKKKATPKKKASAKKKKATPKKKASAKKKKAAPKKKASAKKKKAAPKKKASAKKKKAAPKKKASAKKKKVAPKKKASAKKKKVAPKKKATARKKKVAPRPRPAAASTAKLEEVLAGHVAEILAAVKTRSRPKLSVGDIRTALAELETAHADLGKATAENDRLRRELAAVGDASPDRAAADETGKLRAAIEQKDARIAELESRRQESAGAADQVGELEADLQEKENAIRDLQKRREAEEEERQKLAFDRDRWKARADESERRLADAQRRAEIDALVCPRCDGEMLTEIHNGVEIDRCTECKGVFLDRGELETIVDIELEARAREAAGADGEDEDDAGEDDDPRGAPGMSERSSTPNVPPPAF